VCAPSVGIIEDDHVPWPEVAALDGGLDGERHRAQMHGHVIALGNHLPGRVEQSARIVAPFLDIGRKRGAFQRGAHFFRNRMKQAFEDFELDGIDHADLRLS
jgi:hypothetical protein